MYRGDGDGGGGSGDSSDGGDSDGGDRTQGGDDGETTQASEGTEMDDVDYYEVTLTCGIFSDGGYCE